MLVLIFYKGILRIPMFCRKALRVGMFCRIRPTLLTLKSGSTFFRNLLVFIYYTTLKILLDVDSTFFRDVTLQYWTILSYNSEEHNTGLQIHMTLNHYVFRVFPEHTGLSQKPYDVRVFSGRTGLSHNPYDVRAFSGHTSLSHNPCDARVFPGFTILSHNSCDARVFPGFTSLSHNPYDVRVFSGHTGMSHNPCDAMVFPGFTSLSHNPYDDKYYLTRTTVCLPYLLISYKESVRESISKTW